MTNEQFLEGLNTNIKRVREYKLGMDGRNGQCDCIGLIIGAIRLSGGVWNGTHGSNYAARNEMDGLGEIVTSKMLSVGDVVYKAKVPGQSGYALPSTYDKHPDKHDYYHVGVVTKVEPLEITHCTSVSGGIKRDTTLGQWQYVGRLKKITEESDMGDMSTYIVIGGNLRMRSGPDVTSPVIVTIPNESTVKAAEIAGNDEWMFCSYAGRSGYCMKQYLKRYLSKAENPNKLEEEQPNVVVTLPYDIAKALHDVLGVALEVTKK